MWTTCTTDRAAPKQLTIPLRHATRWEAGGAAAPPDFGGSINPISTRGDTLSPPSTTCPPGFLTLVACLICIWVFQNSAAWGQNLRLVHNYTLFCKTFDMFFHIFFCLITVTFRSISWNLSAYQHVFSYLFLSNFITLCQSWQNVAFWFLQRGIHKWQ